jgi:hypothetical protein
LKCVTTCCMVHRSSGFVFKQFSMACHSSSDTGGPRQLLGRGRVGRLFCRPTSIITALSFAGAPFSSVYMALPPVHTCYKEYERYAWTTCRTWTHHDAEASKAVHIARLRRPVPAIQTLRRLEGRSPWVIRVRRLPTQLCILCHDEIKVGNERLAVVCNKNILLANFTNCQTDPTPRLKTFLVPS